VAVSDSATEVVIDVAAAAATAAGDAADATVLMFPLQLSLMLPTGLALTVNTNVIH
jgi:hypothetical protein